MKAEKELIYSVLSELYPTYEREAPDDIPANYLVYHLDEIQQYHERNDYSLVVNCITKVTEVDEPEDLDVMVKAVKDAFYFKSFNDDGYTYTFYFDSASEVEEKDRSLKRYDVRFTLTGYEGDLVI
jgi:hypothetical protein